MELEPSKIDENLYSRQIAVYGAETMGKLITMKVLVVGLRGIGVETAKNLILAGPASVVLHDDDISNISDQGVNFYVTDSDIGKQSRADCSLPQLKELNDHVKVSVHKGEINLDVLAQFNLVLITDFYDREKLIQWNEFCHNKGIGFIYSGNLGLYGFAFVDFGDSHTILDKDGQEVKSAIVSHISQEEKALVRILPETRHDLEDGDWVTFREIQGMTQLNGNKYKVTVKGPQDFWIECDTREFSEYTREGQIESVKMPNQVKFSKLAQSLINPVPPHMKKDGMYLLDYEKFDAPPQLHITFNAVLEFFAKHKQLPEFQNEDHAEELYQFALAHNKSIKDMAIEDAVQVEELNKEYVKNVARYSRANISPLASFWGGILAQEIVKFTGKFTPLQQWLHYECFELLPEPGENVDRTRRNTRYDDYISILGVKTIEKLSKQKVFMVGAGALGCEFLKLFSLIGLGCSLGGDPSQKSEGYVTVTDDDNIEISNLNRQFLFRKHNVGFPKSVSATNAVKKMNKALNVKAIKSRVAPQTEELFNDHFWNDIDFVVNAVDNVAARRFVDAKCVWFKKPLFESGTLGTQCNSQIIRPHETQSYGDSQDPEEKGIPMCTLKNFPYQIEHTIQWSRDYFEGIFASGYGLLNKFLQNKKKFLDQAEQVYNEKKLSGMVGPIRSELETTKKVLALYIGHSYEKCVETARNLFDQNFHNQIADLLHAYPADYRTEEGNLFWSAPKRAPTIIKFDPADPKHIEFIQSTANIYSCMIGIPLNTNKQHVAQIVSQIHVEPYVPKVITIKVDEKDEKPEKAEDDDQVIQNLLKELHSLNIVEGRKLNPIEFEKDDPTNWHIEFVSSVANLRARNYSIKEVDNFKVKLIAGKIIPALATTTAMIVGAVGIEILKHVLGKPIQKMKNAFINLALPLWQFTEPMPAIKNVDQEMDVIMGMPSKAIPPNWTTWDVIEIQGPMTLGQLEEHFKKQFGVVVSMASYENLCLYVAFQKAQAQLRVNRDIKELIEELTGNPLPPWKKYIQLVVGADIDDDTTANMPTIKYAFR